MQNQKPLALPACIAWCIQARAQQHNRGKGQPSDEDPNNKPHREKRLLHTHHITGGIFK
jgi:hypothetical protein